MNKTMYLGAVALSLLTGPPALADERGATVGDGFSGFLTPDWDRDLSVTLGTKVWLNEWARDREFLSSSAFTGFDFVFASDSAPDAQESDIEPVPIPQLSVRYKWLIVTGGYYSKTGFDFGTTSGFVQRFNLLTGEFDLLSSTLFEASGERYEWDASAGIYVHPYVAILGGYKKVRQKIDTTTTITDLPGTPAAATFAFREFTDIDIEGPTIGIAASVPIGGGFGMYGSYAHGFMDTKIRSVFGEGQFPSETSPDFDTTYNVAEVGFSYTHGVEHLMPHMPLSAATAYAGYRYQRISTDFDVPDSQDAGDVTEGFAVGVNFSF